MGLASTTSTSSSLLSTALCTARRSSLPSCHSQHHHLRFLSTFRSLGKDTAQRVRCSAVEDEACELVNGFELSIGEGDDNIQAFLFKAVKNNNGTGVLLLSDVFGFQDSATRDFAYQVACHGYNVLVPDLFRGDPWEKGQKQCLNNGWLAKTLRGLQMTLLPQQNGWLMNLQQQEFQRNLVLLDFVLEVAE